MMMIAAVGLLLLAVGCRDTCGDILCAPAPPLLQVAVIDTGLDTVRMAVERTNPARIDTIDTVVVAQVRVSDAVVTLLRVDGTDTTTFDTLAPSGDLYTRSESAGLPSTPFIVRAERNGRRTQQGGLTQRNVDGCCPYSVVGFYRLQLPLF